jgi:hypothetical protein
MQQRLSEISTGLVVHLPISYRGLFQSRQHVSWTNDVAFVAITIGWRGSLLGTLPQLTTGLDRWKLEWSNMKDLFQFSRRKQTVSLSLKEHPLRKHIAGLMNVQHLYTYE